MNKKLLALAAGAVLLAAAQNGFAGSLSVGTLSPVIILSAGCTAVTATGVNFGVHATDSNNLTDANAGQIVVTCPLDLTYRVMVNGGQNPRAATLRRRMKRVGFLNLMSYNLKLLNSGMMVGDKNPIPAELYTATAKWADGIGPVVGNGFPQSYSLIADVEISTSPTAGVYIDSVAVTVQW